ncbi:beta strand repeat-containing protein [Bradyrhizobium sp. DASA03120]|uniref:beta strand repeat-containing protein n=1 Tax=Bradyrhizobium sp. SMVTL-02 TaxID=3395917 RepID=UPI003F717792
MADFIVRTVGLQPTVTTLPDGHFVVTYTTFELDGSTDIRARLFNPDGTAVGADFIVNTTTLFDQIEAEVTALPDGHFVVTWQSVDGGDGSGSLIRARLFNADGTAVGDDFIVNSTTFNSQVEPTVTALPDGHFVVTWRSEDGGDGSGTLIRARLFNADGTAVDDDFIVNSTTFGSQSGPTVTALPDGHFVVTWQSNDGGDGSDSLIRARLFNADGTAVDNDFVVNSTTFLAQFAPTVTALPDGHFVVTWYSADGGDGSGFLIRARLFNADGTAADGDFIVNSTVAGRQSEPTVTALPDGHFAVTWYSSDGGDGSGSLIRARLFNADGTAAGDDFIVNTTTAGDQVEPTVTALPDGNLVVTWQSNEPGPTQIRAIIIDPAAAANIAPTITSNGGGDTAAVSVAENSTAVTTVVATDPDAGQTLNYTISGGADAAKFTLNATTHALTFVTAPDFEAPGDAGANNVYDVTVQVADGNGGIDTQAIAVTVANQNEAPTITSNGGGSTAAISTAENTTAVTTVAASDPDGQTLTYSISGGADSNKFSINATTGALAFVTAPNFEAPSDTGGNNVYDVTVQAADGNGGIDTQAIAVTVTNQHEAPATASATVTAAEDTTYTFTLADFAFNDADQSSDALRHIVITSIPAAGTLALNGVAITAAQVASGLVVSPAAIASGLLTFTAGADANGSDYATFDFHVRDDGVGAGTAGTWTFSGSGADDSGNDHHLALTGGAGFAPGLFGEALALDGAKGSGAVLSTDPSAFDFGSSDFTVELWVKFDDLSRESTLIEKFTNDSGPGWTFTVLGDHRLQFYAAGVAVLTSDPLTIATGEWHQFVAERSGTTFNLFVDGTQVLSGSGGGAIIPSSGPLLIGGRNAGDPRNFTVDGVVDNVTIWDHALSTTQISQHWNGGAGIDPGENVSQTATVTIDVSAVNDPPTITSNGGGDTAAVSVAENSTAVTTVVATDPDAGQTLNYTISGGADAAKFTLNATTHALTFVTAPDFEAPGDAGANNVYDVTVQVADGNGGIDTQAIAVTVANQNEAPTITSNGGGSTAAISTAENTTAVTTVAASDPDGQTLTYSISGGADSNKFSINATTGALAFVTAPNFEAPSDTGGNNVYDVTVQAADGNGGIDTQAIAVTVQNANEAPTITSNGGGDTAAVSVAENSTAVTTVVATDPDAGQTLNYTISGGADAAKFTLNATTHALTFVTAPDFEAPGDAGANNVYDVTVQVADGNGGIDTQAIAVTVANQNEAPTITSNGGGSTAAISTAENTTAVTTVAASDPDGQTLTYSISGGADSNKFSINATTGALAFVTAPNFEAPSDTGGNNVYDVTVQAADGNGGIDTQAIAVTVQNANEAPTITSNGGGDTAAVSVAENSTAVTTVVATDPDAGQTLNYTISGGADAAKFTLNATTHALTFVTAPDFEAPGDAGANNVYDVTVQVADGNGGIDTQAIAVTVTNVAGVSLINNDPTITGTNEEDALTGLDGNNTLQGLLGNDILKGGAGNDNFLYRVGDGADTIDGGKQADTLTITGMPGSSADTIHVVVSGVLLSGVEGGTITNVEKAFLDLGAGTDTLSYTGTTSGVSVNLSTSTATGFNSISGVENVTGGSGNDTLTGNSAANTLFGGDGGDLFVFTNLANSLAPAFDTIDFTSGDHLQIGHKLMGLTTGIVKSGGTGNLAADLASVLNTGNLSKNGAAEVTITGGTDAGTYVVINDNTAGYNASNDGVVMLVGAPLLHTTDFIV